jgi:hypothetical protein
MTKQRPNHSTPYVYEARCRADLNAASKEGKIGEAFVALKKLCQAWRTRKDKATMRTEESNFLILFSPDEYTRAPLRTEKSNFLFAVGILFSPDEHNRAALSYAAQGGHAKVVEAYLSLFLLARTVATLPRHDQELWREIQTLDASFQTWIDVLPRGVGAPWFPGHRFRACWNAIGRSPFEALPTYSLASITAIYDSFIAPDAGVFARDFFPVKYFPPAFLPSHFDKINHRVKAPCKKLPQLNHGDLLDVDDKESPYVDEWWRQWWCDDDSISKDNEVDESRGDIGNNEVAPQVWDAHQQLPPKPEDFPALEGGQEYEYLSIPTDLDDTYSVGFSSEEEDVGSFVNVCDFRHLNAAEEWEVVSNAGTVISMDSKLHFSYRDALCDSGSKLDSTAHCPSILPFDRMTRKSLLPAEPSTYSLSKRLDLLPENDDAKELFDAYSVMDGVKNSRGGFRKYRTRTRR